MKHLFLTLPLLLLFIAARSQSSKLRDEYYQIENSLNDTLKQDIFLDSNFCSKYNLKNSTRNFRRMNYWDNTLHYKSPDFISVYDIRWVFKSNKEALEFHKRFLPINSEGGIEIKKSGIAIDSTTNLRIFREDDGTRQMNKDFGYPMNYYYFIFVVDNTVAKVFVSAKPGVTVDQAAVFAMEASRRINNAKNKK
jgi:hypothetical protein